MAGRAVIGCGLTKGRGTEFKVNDGWTLSKPEDDISEPVCCSSGLSRMYRHRINGGAHVSLSGRAALKWEQSNLTPESRSSGATGVVHC
jgi:hypothetical protein